MLVIASFVLGNRITGGGVRRYVVALLAIEVAQIIVGIAQAENGLPIALVNIHLVLAGLLVAAVTGLILSERASEVAPSVSNLQF